MRPARSLRWSHRRAALFTSERAAPAGRAAAAGSRATPRAFSVRPRRARQRLAVVPIFAAALFALLALTTLRLSILRARYALGATLQRETELLSRERSAAVDVRVARDPRKLRELAAERGFARPERVIDLSREAPSR